MPWGWGRGWRWMYWLTGMPGWMRASYGIPAFGWARASYSPFAFWPGWGRGNPFWFCRWFPWLPRWWWTGMYGPVQWTPQGPVLASQVSGAPQAQAPMQPLAKEQEIQYLEEELRALEKDRRMIEEEMKAIRERLEELKKQA